VRKNPRGRAVDNERLGLIVIPEQASSFTRIVHDLVRSTR
jgi:hypothetical protein